MFPPHHHLHLPSPAHLLWTASLVHPQRLKYFPVPTSSRRTDGLFIHQCPEARCPARRMLVNARQWRNNSSWSGVAYTTSGSKARSNARWRGRSLTFKTRWRMCFSGFPSSRSPSFVFMKTFSLFFFFLTDRTRTAVKVIFLLISVQFIFFHALWMAIFLSFYFS